MRAAASRGVPALPQHQRRQKNDDDRQENHARGGQDFEAICGEKTRAGIECLLQAFAAFKRACGGCGAGAACCAADAAMAASARAAASSSGPDGEGEGGAAASALADGADFRDGAGFGDAPPEAGSALARLDAF